MAILIETKRSVFYNELTDDLRKEYFDLKYKKYLHKIDTLYYSVFIKGDRNDDDTVKFFIDDVKEIKENLFSTGEESLDFCEGLEILRGRHADYAHRLSVRDCYDIFIVTHIRNSNTPRILVQIRSSYIWKNGIDNAIYDSYNKVSKLLKLYGLEIDKVQENRLDYAYHTNCIQSPEKFFDVKSVSQTYKGSFKQGRNVFNLLDDSYSIDYLGLGSPKSNNLYFRIYNKTREVVEMNYKSFFFDIWYEEGLINFYDKFCLEYAYINGGNYDKIYEGSLHFYLKYGKDDEIKRSIIDLLSYKDCTFKDIFNLYKQLMPPVTKILNIEFETKRKYYYYYEDVINLLPCTSKIPQLDKLFKIVENRKIFLDMLTTKVVSFEKDGKVMDFWKRLINVKIKSLSKDKLKATYSDNVDMEKLKNRALNAVMSYSVHKDNLNDDIVSDFIDILVDLNDNDIKSNKFGALDLETGELIEVHNSKLKDLYKDKKNKKYKQIKNRKK